MPDGARSASGWNPNVASGKEIIKKVLTRIQMETIVSVVPMNLPLKLAIVASAFSQIELAGETGIHESRLSKIVNGHIDPNRDEQAALAKVLRKPKAELFPQEAA